MMRQSISQLTKVNRIVQSGKLGGVREIEVMGELFSVPKFIYATQSGQKDGWNIDIQRQDLTYRKHFSTKAYGGRQQALDNAILHLAEKFFELQSQTSINLQNRFYQSRDITPAATWVLRDKRTTYTLSLTVTLNNRCSHLHAYTTHAGTLKTLTQQTIDNAYYRCIGAHHWVAKHRGQGVSPEKVPPLPARTVLEKTGRRVGGACSIALSDILRRHPNS